MRCSSVSWGSLNCRRRSKFPQSNPPPPRIGGNSHLIPAHPADFPLDEQVGASAKKAKPYGCGLIRRKNSFPAPGVTECVLPVVVTSPHGPVTEGAD